MSALPVSVTVTNASGLTATANAVANVTDAGYDNLTNWPSTANRPQWSNTGGAGTLTWIGPVAGGPSTGNDVLQSLALTASTSISSTANGQVIEGRNISSGASITHSNVTLRRCYIHVGGGGGGFVINPVSGSNIVIEDCFLVGNLNGGVGTYYGVTNAPNLFGPNLTVRRCAFKGWDNSLGSDWRDGLVIDNLFYGASGYTSSSHVDLIEVYTQQATLPLALTIKHNTFDCAGPLAGDWASGLNVGALGRVDNLIIDNNCWINTANRQFGLTYSFYSSAPVRITTTNNGVRNTSAFWGLSGGLTRIMVAADSGNFNMASDTATSGTPWGGNGRIH